VKKLIFFFLIASVGFAVTTNIEVYGYESGIVKPDSARIEIRITEEGLYARESQDQNKKITEAVYSAISNLDIKPKDVSTIGYLVTPIYSPQNKKLIMKYVTTIILSIELRRLDITGRLIDAVVKAGATSVDQIYFYLDDYNNLQKEILKKAIENAKTKGVLIAEEMNIKNLKISEVIELLSGSAIADLEGKVKLESKVKVIFTKK